MVGRQIVQALCFCETFNVLQKLSTGCTLLGRILPRGRGLAEMLLRAIIKICVSFLLKLCCLEITYTTHTKDILVFTISCPSQPPIPSPLLSSPPSNGGLDPTCLPSTGQSTEPQALWFWRVLERHPRARSVGDNPGGWPHGSLIPADGVRPGVDTAAALAGPPGLTGSSPGCPHSHRQLARQPSLRPSIT